MKRPARCSVRAESCSTSTRYSISTKSSSRAYLGSIEDGRSLISSTTENPYYYIYHALLSRRSVFEFKPVCASEIKRALTRAYRILCQEDGKEFTQDAPLPKNVDETFSYIASAACGDVRRALGALELCYGAAGENMSLSLASQSISAYSLKMDKDGNEHYDLMSAFQKSIRGSDPDAAVFYLAKMLEAGDLLSPIRRLLVIASEDIGLLIRWRRSWSRRAVTTPCSWDFPKQDCRLRKRSSSLLRFPNPIPPITPCRCCRRYPCRARHEYAGLYPRFQPAVSR